MLKRLSSRCRLPTSGGGKENVLEHLVWSAAWLREAEPAAAASQNISLAQLMERAGEAAFSVCQHTYPQSRHWLILVGPGNNGGDGYVVARHAKALGAEVTVAVIPPKKPLPIEAAKAKAAWESVQGSETLISESWSAPSGVDIVVDGLLGTGLTGAPRGLYSQVITQVNALPVPRVAIDIPSGLNAETGEVAGECFKADHTVTFICLKPGLLTGAARSYVGQLHYHALGLSDWMLDPFRLEAAACHRVNAHDLAIYFGAPRGPCAHKGSNGKVLLIGGEVGFGGAIIMAAEAALSAGAGLVRVFTAPEHVTPLLVRCPEVMVTSCESNATDSLRENLTSALSWCNTVAIGPGLGQQSFGQEALKTVLQHAAFNPSKTVVFDADALNLLAQLKQKGEMLPQLPQSILTPHPGEAARLLQCTVKEVEQNRLESAHRLAEIFGGACILKGPGSVVYSQPEKKTTIVDAGNAGMATGGMGDVLTGVAGGLAGQGLFQTVDTLACASALAHSSAADLAVASREGGCRGLRATDIIPFVRSCVNADE